MKKNKVIVGLLVTVVLLILFIVGMFVIKPAIQKYRDKMINAGMEYAVFLLMQEVSTCKLIPLTFENQTIEVIAIECLQQQAQAVPQDLE